MVYERIARSFLFRGSQELLHFSKESHNGIYNKARQHIHISQYTSHENMHMLIALPIRPLTYLDDILYFKKDFKIWQSFS